MALIDAALELAAAGFKVFPIAAGQKKPPVMHWQKWATADADKIRKWWSAHPDANIGISTAVDTSGRPLLAVDIDVKHGKDGFRTLQGLTLLDGLTLPATFTQRTPTGGAHVVFYTDAPVSNRAGNLGPGVDIRGAGGYIVGAGSLIGDEAYTADFAPLAKAPDWLVERCLQRHEPAAAKAGTEAPSAETRAIRHLDGLPLAVEGGRNNAAFRAAATLKDFGLNEAACLDLMQQHWKANPPLGQEELQVTVGSAFGRPGMGSQAPEQEFEVVKKKDGAKLSPLAELNIEYAWVMCAGSSRILWETTDAKGSPTVEHLPVGVFHQKLAAQTMMVGKKRVKLTEEWMSWPERRDYDGIVFAPQQDFGPRWYNLWRGFTVQPARTGTGIAKTGRDLWLEHIRRNVCSDDPNQFDWFMGYVAHMVQRPSAKPLTSIVMRGGKGVGKNMAVKPIQEMLGRHALLVSDKRYLIGNFNSHLERCLLLVLNEAFWSGDKQTEGILKHLITGDEHVIERKGVEPYVVDNLTRIMILGNEHWLVPASHDERRFAVFDIGAARQQDRAFFTAMRKGLQAGGLGLLLDYLLHYEIKTDVDEAPATRALAAQKIASLPPFQAWWFDCLLAGEIVSSDFGGEWPQEVDTDRLRDAFHRFIRETGREREWHVKTTAVQFGRMLRQCSPAVTRARKREGNGLCWVYTMPALDAARQEWQDFIGSGVDWATGEPV